MKTVILFNVKLDQLNIPVELRIFKIQPAVYVKNSLVPTEIAQEPIRDSYDTTRNLPISLQPRKESLVWLRLFKF